MKDGGIGEARYNFTKRYSVKSQNTKENMRPSLYTNCRGRLWTVGVDHVNDNGHINSIIYTQRLNAQQNPLLVERSDTMVLGHHPQHTAIGPWFVSLETCSWSLTNVTGDIFLFTSQWMLCRFHLVPLRVRRIFTSVLLWWLGPSIHLWNIVLTRSSGRALIVWEFRKMINIVVLRLC